ncbi:MAG: hypothetical protein JXA20_01420 [Spirochaetes bacterium]|nr:hypothetical protein [Spirochaetota bacterium]
MREVKEDHKVLFKNALYDVVECLIKYEVSHTAKTLINHYFNMSESEETLSRAIEAIEKYTQEQIPTPENRTPRLSRLLDELAFRAKRWDAETP